MLERFLQKTSFDSYEEFARDYRVTVPERFNFAGDVVDEIAAADPPAGRAVVVRRERR